MLWVDPNDPEVFAAVVGSDEEADPELVTAAVAVASELLTMVTAYKVHPAGEITEDFVSSHANRLSLLWGPVTGVTSVKRVQHDDSESDVPYRRIGQTLYLNFNRPGGSSWSIPLWRINGLGLGVGNPLPMQHLYRVVYQFANTVTPAASRALLTYAHQIFLLSMDSEDCELPERVTSITREGIGMQLITPQDYLDAGRTGLPSVDDWLAKVNPPVGAMRGIGGKPSLRPSQVFTPDSPPGVGNSLRRLP